MKSARIHPVEHVAADRALLLGRILMGTYFLTNGIFFAFTLEDRAAATGTPIAAEVLNMGIELVLGTMIIVGFKLRWAAGFQILWLTLKIFVGHMDFSYDTWPEIHAYQQAAIEQFGSLANAPNFGWPITADLQFRLVMSKVALIAGCLYMVFSPLNPFSIDARLRNDLESPRGQ